MGVERDADHPPARCRRPVQWCLPIALAGIGHRRKRQAGALRIVVADDAPHVLFSAVAPRAESVPREQPLRVLVSDLHRIEAGPDAGVIHRADEPVAELVVVDQATVADCAIQHFQLGAVGDPRGLLGRTVVVGHDVLFPCTRDRPRMRRGGVMAPLPAFRYLPVDTGSVDRSPLTPVRSATEDINGHKSLIVSRLYLPARDRGVSPPTASSHRNARIMVGREGRLTRPVRFAGVRPRRAPGRGQENCPGQHVDQPVRACVTSRMRRLRSASNHSRRCSSPWVLNLMRSRCPVRSTRPVMSEPTKRSPRQAGKRSPV